MKVEKQMKEGTVNAVPLLDLRAQYRDIRAEVDIVIQEVCESQMFVMGPKVSALEEQLAEYSQSAFGIGVSSGTDALLVALMALDIGPGDEVITTPFTFFATGGVIARVGARPVFCDIDSSTFNLDPIAVAEFLSDGCKRNGECIVNSKTGGRVRAIMPVHLFGQMAEMSSIMKIAMEYGLRVVEDAAQAIGAEEDGRRAGSIGDIGCFSFFPSKNLGAFGDGGMCVTDDPIIAEKLRVLRLHGGKPKYYHAVIGGNFRLDAIQAAVLLVKLKYLDVWTSKRQANAGYYDDAIARKCPVVETPVARNGVRHIFNQYTLRVARRDELREFLSNKHVGTEVYYPVPLHLQECFGDLGYAEGDLPVSEEAANSVLSIPVYPEMSNEQMNYVIDCLGSFSATVG